MRITMTLLSATAALLLSMAPAFAQDSDTPKQTVQSMLSTGAIALPGGKVVGVRQHAAGRLVAKAAAGAAEDDASVSIVSDGFTAYGVVRTDGKAYRVRSRKGVLEVLEMEPSLDLSDDIVGPRSDGVSAKSVNYNDPTIKANRNAMNANKTPVPSEGAAIPAGADQRTIRVLVLYSDRFLESLGGVAEVRAAAQSAVSTTRTVFGNTLLETDFELVGIEYFEPSEHEAGAVLNEAFELVHGDWGADALRQAYAADLVVVLDLYDSQYSVGTLGLGDALTAVYQPSDHGSALTRVRHDTSWERVTAHEVGHNFGMGHQREASSGFIYSFSYAYHCGTDQFGSQLNDIMWTNGGFHDFFSTPLLDFGGEPCGVSGTDGADGRTTLMKTADVVSKLRPDLVSGGALSLSAPSSVAEGAGSYDIVLTRSGDTSKSASVDLVIVPTGDATAGTDFVAPALQTVSFGAGVTERRVSVQVPDNGAYNTQAGVLAFAQKGIGVTASPDDAVTTAIVDNDAVRGEARLSRIAYSVRENAGSMTIGLTRVNGSQNSITVRVRTVNGTAIAGTHFDAIDTLVTFDNGQTAKSVQIPIRQNADVDGSKSFTVELVGDNVSSTNNIATVTITDDDGASSGGGGGGGALGAWMLALLFGASALRRRVAGGALS